MQNNLNFQQIVLSKFPDAIATEGVDGLVYILNSVAGPELGFGVSDDQAWEDAYRRTLRKRNLSA